MRDPSRDKDGQTGFHVTTMDTSEAKKTLKKKVQRDVLWGQNDPTPNIKVPWIAQRI